MFRNAVSAGKVFIQQETEEIVSSGEEVGQALPDKESNSQEETSAPQLLSSSAESTSQLQAKELLKKAIIAQEVKILSLSGAKGSGKSVVLKTAIHELKDSEMVWLSGECSAITQLSPCGLIQDICLRFLT